MTDPRRIACYALPLLLVGCYDDDYDCTPCDDNVVYESEVNDHAAVANWIGVLYPGDALSIRGHVTQFGPDLFDGFAFVTGAPMQIDVSLFADVVGADLDLCVWDPAFGQFVACFETAVDPESGSFVVLEANKEIHLVVRSFQGDSAYWLDVFGLAAPYGALALPAQAPQRAPQSWEAYAPANVAEDPLPGREALILEFAADGSLAGAKPARVAFLGADARGGR